MLYKMPEFLQAVLTAPFSLHTSSNSFSALSPRPSLPKHKKATAGTGWFKCRIGAHHGHPVAGRRQPSVPCAHQQFDFLPP